MDKNDFFNRSHLPEPFNQAALGEQTKENEYDEPQHNFNPPELVPGGTHVREVAREELDGPTQDAIQDAQDRMQLGMDERDQPIHEQEGWSQEEIREVENEDRDRGLGLEAEWNEQARHEYDRWALDTLAAEHDDKWGEKEAIEQAEQFQRNIDRSTDREIEHEGHDHEH